MCFVEACNSAVVVVRVALQPSSSTSPGLRSAISLPHMNFMAAATALTFASCHYRHFRRLVHAAFFCVFDTQLLLKSMWFLSHFMVFGYQRMPHSALQQRICCC
jgi:hypothetical protein